METKDTILNKIYKVYNLTLQGVGGEKESAEKLLDKLLKKYNISIERLNENLKEYYSFKFETELEKKLLMQIAYKVFNTSDFDIFYSVTRGGNKRKNVRQLYCTKLEFLEIEFLFEFYKNVLNKEINFLYYAFINKNNLFANEKITEDTEKIFSSEELRKIMKMMDICEDVTPYKQLMTSSNQN